LLASLHNFADAPLFRSAQFIAILTCDPRGIGWVLGVTCDQNDVFDM
jgi:hypothetical protein